MYGRFKAEKIEKRAGVHPGQDAGADRHRPERLFQDRERAAVLNLRTVPKDRPGAEHQHGLFGGAHRRPRALSAKNRKLTEIPKRSAPL